MNSNNHRRGRATPSRPYVNNMQSSSSDTSDQKTSNLSTSQSLTTSKNLRPGGESSPNNKVIINNGNKKRKLEQVSPSTKCTPSKIPTKKLKETQPDKSKTPIPGTTLTNSQVSQFIELIPRKTEAYYEIPPFLMKGFGFSILEYLDYVSPSLQKQTTLRPSSSKLRANNMIATNPLKNVFQPLFQEELIMHVLSFIDYKVLLRNFSRICKSWYVMIRRYCHVLLEDCCHFHYAPNNFRQTERMIGEKNIVKYLTGNSVNQRRVKLSSQTLKYLEWNIFYSTNLLENCVFPSLTHLKLNGRLLPNANLNIESIFTILKPLFQNLTSLIVGDAINLLNDDMILELFKELKNIRVINFSKVSPKKLENACFALYPHMQKINNESNDGIRNIKIGNCATLKDFSLNFIGNTCGHLLRVLHLNNINNYHEDISLECLTKFKVLEELCITNSCISLTTLTGYEIGQNLRVLDVRGTKWSDEHSIYCAYKKQSKTPNLAGKEEVILYKQLNWLKPIHASKTPRILKFILTSNDIYYYGLSQTKGKGFEWWTRFVTVASLFDQKQPIFRQ